MNKKIYLISQTESHLTQRGKRHPNLADYLANKDYDLTYISSDFYHADKRHFKKTEIVNAQSQLKYKLKIINSIGYYSNISLKRILSNLLFSWKTFKFLSKQKLDDSIIIVPSRPVEILYFLSKIKKKSNVKVIVDIRDVWPDAFNINNKVFKTLFLYYCDFFQSDSIKLFDDFIHTCPGFTDWLNRYAPQKESVLIPLGYDKERFQKYFIDTPRTFKENMNFVYIGLLQKQIDIIPFIDAISNNSNYSLDIYGDEGEGENYTLVKNFITENNIKNVYLKGKVPQSEVPLVLTNYDIGLMPMNAKFAFPNKVFDYIAMSLPIFSIGKHDTSSFVNKNEIGWVCDYNKANIQKSLIEVIDYNLYNKFSTNILKIRDNFSREKVFKTIENKIQCNN
jgi:hypothetical protein